MNAMAERDQSRDVAPVRQPQASKAEKVARSLRSIREKLLAPFAAWDQIRKPYQAYGGKDCPGFLDLTMPYLEQPKSEDHRAKMLADMDAITKRQPSDAALGEVSTALSAALGADFDRPMTRLCVALMIDAFPNARPHSPETYQETLVEELAALSFGPAVVARACNEAVRSSTFLPTASEVIAAATKAHGELRGAFRWIERYWEQQDRFEANRQWLVKAELMAEDRSNYDRPRYDQERSR